MLAAQRRNTEIDLNFDPKELSRAKVMAFRMQQHKIAKVSLKFENHFPVILLEIDCAIFYTNLHELFCQFIT